MERAVFQKVVIQFTTFLHEGEIPLISVDFSDKICNKKIWKNSHLKGHKTLKEFTTQCHHFWVGEIPPINIYIYGKNYNST